MREAEVVEKGRSEGAWNGGVAKIGSVLTTLFGPLSSRPHCDCQKIDDLGPDPLGRAAEGHGDTSIFGFPPL